MSTVEALALALERIGETEDAINPIFDALKINVDAVMLLWGKPAVYGNSFPKGPVMQALPSRKAE